MLTKDLLDPRHTSGPMDTMRVGDTIGIYAPQPRSTGCIAEVFEEADAALFAVAPELAKAVREYLEGLEGGLEEAERYVQMTCLTTQAGAGAEKFVRATLAAEVTARRALSAAQPLYDLLVRVCGTKEETNVQVVR